MDPPCLPHGSYRTLALKGVRAESYLTRLFSIRRGQMEKIVKDTFNRHRQALDGNMFREAMKQVLQDLLPSSFYTRRRLKKRDFWRYLAIICYFRQSVKQYTDDDGQPLASFKETLTEVFQTIYPLCNIVCNIRKRTVDRWMLSETGDLTCGICLMDVRRREKLWYLPCDHWYHKECLRPWILQNPDCPKCRAAAWGGWQDLPPC